MERFCSVEVRGLAGGCALELEGVATHERATGRFGLGLRSSGPEPLLVDPALVVLSVLDLVLMATLGADATPPAALQGDEVLGRIQTQVLEEGLRGVGSVEAVGHQRGEGEGRRLVVEVLHADVVAEPMERITALDPDHMVLARPTGDALLAALGTLSLSTGRGRDWSLVTTTMATPAEVEGILELRLQELLLRRDPGALHVGGRVSAVNLRSA